MTNVAAKLQARMEAQFVERAGRELGIPEGTPVVAFRMDAGTMKPEWEGYSLDFIGEPAPPPNNALDSIYAESNGVGMRVWQISIRGEGTQAYIEARTRPGWLNFISVDLRNLDYFDRGGNVDMLTHGMAMLYPRVFRSRPRGTGYFSTAQDFHEAYRDVVATMKRENTKPKSELIAYRLGLSRSSFYDYKRKYGLGDDRPD